MQKDIIQKQQDSINTYKADIIKKVQLLLILLAMALLIPIERMLIQLTGMATLGSKGMYMLILLQQETKMLEA
jgi:hypothetical protein